MRVCVFVIALVAGMIAFVPTPVSADIGPCNNCPASGPIVPGPVPLPPGW